MVDTKSALHVQASAASMAPHGATNAKGLVSASPAPLQASIPVPQLSPVTGRTGRRLHTKVLEELKNVTSRKSPAINASATPTCHMPLPSPLNLNTVTSIESSYDSASADGADGSSPRIPAPQNGNAGKSKACGICERSFTVFRAKHTCKMCSKKICDDCSKNRVKLNRRLERRKGSRFCDMCAREYMQHTTPLQSPTEVRIPEELNGHDSSSGGDAASSSSTPVKLSHSRSSVESPAEGFHQRTAFKIQNSILSYDPKAMGGASYLRPRHWFSLFGAAGLLFARLVRFQAVAGYATSRDDEQRELIVEAQGVMLFLLSLTDWIDRLASLRVIVSYLLGLVAYDEFIARSKRRTRRISAHSATTAAMPVLTASKTRSRTRSAMSEASHLAPHPASNAVHAVSGRRRQEEEVLEVEVGDKTVDDGLGFSVDKLLSALTECTTKNRTSDGDMRMSCFLSSCDQICGFILVFGRATAFAGSTVTGYMSTIGTNLAEWPVTGSAANSAAFSWKEQSVRAITQREVDLQVAAAGGKKKPSCSRCVLRLLWFIEFVEACVRYTLLENKDESCAAGASKAYEETIGARHPWIIRKGVNSALGSLPTRSAILESLQLHETAPEDAMAQLNKVQAVMKAMIDDVTAVLKEQNLMDIK